MTGHLAQRGDFKQRGWDESAHPREPSGDAEGGQFAGGGGGNNSDEHKFQTEKLITDGPREGTSRVGVVKDAEIGIWGASHSGSFTITGQSAKVMGIAGYKDNGASTGSKRLSDKFLKAIADSSGSTEPLYHGFSNVEAVQWKVGDIVKLPLLATCGDESDSAGYGEKSAVHNYRQTVFAFPVGTALAGYSRWDRERTKEFGHTWSEAIVAGEFKISGLRIGGNDSAWRNSTKEYYDIVDLVPVSVFDPTNNKWRKA